MITRKDTFYLRNTADVGTITAIAIKRDESGWFPKWQLARVSRELYMSKFSHLCMREVQEKTRESVFKALMWHMSSLRAGSEPDLPGK